MTLQEELDKIIDNVRLFDPIGLDDTVWEAAKSEILALTSKRFLEIVGEDETDIKHHQMNWIPDRKTGAVLYPKHNEGWEVRNQLRAELRRAIKETWGK